MSASRETIMQALLALLQATAEFKTVSRRNMAPVSIGPAQSPALFLLEASEEYHRQSSLLPPTRHLLVKAIFYNDIGNVVNVIPSTAINMILDALDAALQPDKATGRFTLGALVYSLMIDGAVDKAPGDITGKSLAVVPLRIILP